MIAHIQPIETCGRHWVRIDMDGCELQPRGPFPYADAAEAMAIRIAAVCRAMHTEMHSVVPTPAAQRRHRA